MINMLLLSMSIAAVDQIIKQCIRIHPVGTVLFRVPHVVEVMRQTNTGAAFSMLSGHTLLLATVSLVLLTAVFYLAFIHMQLTYGGRIGFAVLLGGGIGNLIDRILFDGVTDYIRLLPIRFPVFNFADIAITLSACYLIYLTLTEKLELCPREKHE